MKQSPYSRSPSLEARQESRRYRSSSAALTSPRGHAQAVPPSEHIQTRVGNTMTNWDSPSIENLVTVVATSTYQTPTCTSWDGSVLDDQAFLATPLPHQSFSSPPLSSYEAPVMYTSGQASLSLRASANERNLARSTRSSSSSTHASSVALSHHNSDTSFPPFSAQEDQALWYTTSGVLETLQAGVHPSMLPFSGAEAMQSTRGEPDPSAFWTNNDNFPALTAGDGDHGANLSYTETSIGRSSPLSGRRGSGDSATKRTRKQTTREDATHECHLCGKLFRRSYNHRAHMQTHNPDRVYPFECPEGSCGKKFTRKTDLDRHYESVRARKARIWFPTRADIQPGARTEPKVLLRALREELRTSRHFAQVVSPNPHPSPAHVSYAAGNDQRY